MSRMNHAISNNPVPNPTRDIAEPYAYQVQTANDTAAFAGMDDGDPIRNKKIQRPIALNDPLELYK